jgi:hypothetical protein
LAGTSNSLLGVAQTSDFTLALFAERVEWEIEGLTSAHTDGPLFDVLMRWEVGGKEICIDRISLVDRGTHAASGRRRVQLNMLQMKSGLMSSKFTPGRPGKLASQRGSITKSLDGTTIAGVLVNAERGLQVLVPALARNFPGVLFELGQLHL